jgi:hypothetical protein
MLVFDGLVSIWMVWEMEGILESRAMVESLFRLENDRMVYMNWCQNVSFCLSKYKINKTHMHMLRAKFPSSHLE